jgi:hypothetical protein
MDTTLRLVTIKYFSTLQSGCVVLAEFDYRELKLEQNNTPLVVQHQHQTCAR